MSFIALIIFPVLLAYAAMSDLLTMRLPNKLTGSIFICFLVLAIAAQMPLSLIGMNLSCGLAMLVVGFGMYARGWIGGGDAKLLAAIAAWLGWSALLDFVLLTAMLGGAMSLIILQWRRWPLPAFMMGAPWLVRLHDPKEGVPYGIALAFGALHVYPHSPEALLILQM